MYGVFNSSCLTLNHAILIGKYFLYICSLNSRRYQFVDLTTLVQEKLELEKYIAISVNKYSSFLKKWVLLCSKIIRFK